ncbi:MAG: hypothetical protein ACYS3S_07145, partial [Planctomycetota bacterium]|jgi:hypothetical protein
MKSKGMTTGHKIGYFFTRRYSLPKSVKRLDQMLKHYHDIDKRSIGNLQRRAGELRTISTLALNFLTSHKLSPTFKDGIKKGIRQKISDPEIERQLWDKVYLSRVELDRVRAKKTTEQELRQEKFNILKKRKYDEAYAAYRDKSFDLVVSKLCRRVSRAAETT